MFENMGTIVPQFKPVYGRGISLSANPTHIISHTFILLSCYVCSILCLWERPVLNGMRRKMRAFLDPNRVIVEDINHSREEDRFYCIGRVGEGIMTVRFTYRDNVIRIYGAGYWRKGRRIYEEQNKIY